MIAPLRTAIFLVAGLVASIYDLRYGRIPHLWTLSAAGLLVVTGIRSFDPIPLLWAAVTLGLFRAVTDGRLGGGDVAFGLLMATYLNRGQWNLAIAVAALLFILSTRRRFASPLSADPGEPFVPSLYLASVMVANLGVLLQQLLRLGRRGLLPGLITLFALAPGAPGFAEDGPEILEVEFREQPIREMLLVLAEATGRSIIPDETVEGTASYHFSRITTEEALRGFAEAYGLFLIEGSGGITVVSRIKVEEEAEGRYTLEAQDAPLETVLRRLAAVSAVPLRWEPLPALRTTFRGGPLSMEELLRALLSPVEAVVEMGESYTLIRSVPRASGERRDRRLSAGSLAREDASSFDRFDSRPRGFAPGFALWQEDSGLWSLEVTAAELRDVLGGVFGELGASYLITGGGDKLLEDIHLEGMALSGLGEAVLAEAGAVAVDRGGWTVVSAGSGSEAPEVEALLILDRWSVGAMERLIRGLAAPGMVVLPDEGRNALLLKGDAHSVGAATAVAASLDEGGGEIPFSLHRLENSSAEIILEALPESLKSFPIRPTPDGSALVARVPTGPREELRRFIEIYDRPSAPRFYPLTSLRAEEFAGRFGGRASIPELLPTPDGRGVLATGTPGEIANLEALLLRIDRPRRQIRYDLLILRKLDHHGSDWNLEAEVTGDPATGAVGLGAIFSGLLTLRFDALAILGYRVAGAISRGLSQHSSQLLADTTIYGLDGAQVSFNNTQTYRYRDLAFDEEEGAVLPTGVTREITSGISLLVRGEVIEGDQVRMEITAEYSRQGVHLSEQDGPPPTSAKRVETVVRTAAGKPIILAGLMQRENEDHRRPVPLLSRIPLLGRLFEPGTSAQESSELVIYLVPHIEAVEAVGFPGTVEELILELRRGVR